MSIITHWLKSFISSNYMAPSEEMLKRDVIIYCLFLAFHGFPFATYFDWGDAAKWADTGGRWWLVTTRHSGNNLTSFSHIINTYVLPSSLDFCVASVFCLSKLFSILHCKPLYMQICSMAFAVFVHKRFFFNKLMTNFFVNSDY